MKEQKYIVYRIYYGDCLVYVGRTKQPLQNRIRGHLFSKPIKNMFFLPEECVIEYHPPRSDYVNNCETCLHLWRPSDGKIPMPPTEFV